MGISLWILLSTRYWTLNQTIYKIIILRKNEKSVLIHNKDICYLLTYFKIQHSLQGIVENDLKEAWKDERQLE